MAIGLPEGLLLDGLHDELEVALGPAVCNFVKHNLRLDLHASRFTNEHALQPLQHLQDVHGIHATVLVVVTELKHHCHVQGS